MKREDLVCIIPAYNEEAVIAQSVELLVSKLREMEKSFLVVIASNGSTDGTDRIGRQLESQFSPNVRLHICAGRGRGAAFRETMQKYPAQSYLYIDADLPCELDDLELITEALKKGADLVVSHRHGPRPLRRRIMTAGLRNLIRAMFNIRVSDPQCAIKGLSVRAANVLVRDCQQPGWFLDTELVVLSHARGLVMREIDIHWIEQRFEHRPSKVKPMRDSVGFLVAMRQIRRRRAAIAAEAEPTVSNSQ